MKKAMKILGIVVLCIIALVIVLVTALMVKNYFDSKKPLLSDDYYTGFKSDSELEKKYSGKDQPYFERLASWGFVVIGNDDKQNVQTTGKVLYWQMHTPRRATEVKINNR